MKAAIAIVKPLRLKIELRWPQTKKVQHKAGVATFKGFRISTK
jgi:hypothetical protein